MRGITTFITVLFAVSISAGQTSSPATEVPPHPARGVYAVWVQEGREGLLDLPFLTGGQICVQWAAVEPEQGRYDFSAIEEKAKLLHDKGLKFTIQINGNNKPKWMFKAIPYFPKGLGQVLDKEGTPMYWHPAFVEASLNFVKAYSDYVQQFPYKDDLVGVRMNINAIGTEAIAVNDPQAKKVENWIVPEGVSKEGLRAWTSEDVRGFQRPMFEAYIKNFAPHVMVLARAHFPGEMIEPALAACEPGRVGLFSTGSRPFEQKNEYFFHVYKNFEKYCRTGKAAGYAEPVADTWGYHGSEGKRMKMPNGPAQTNYWRLLLDLHYGISVIACYGVDLGVAYDGTHPHQPASELKDEYFQAFEFAAKYAGYLKSPSQSPGAWCAVRQMEHKKGDEEFPLTDDCEFLMRRLPDKSAGVTNVGPENQRFGGYARVLPKGEGMRFAVDERFKKSVSGRPTAINLTYLDNQSATIELAAGGLKFPIEMKNSGNWITATFDLPQSEFAADEQGSDISLACAEADLTVHMVEITRPMASSKPMAGQ